MVQEMVARRMLLRVVTENGTDPDAEPGDENGSVFILSSDCMESDANLTT